ncbi:Carbonic anhydrase-related protein [Myotis davidii]|uniref:Carbonic anhydrase-related protein n=1 Tax=Myotis davidii TaxID=225400 RepID=L5LJH6_MYODS|nr:Carbonic anhydrase-related protein [Myotis davidii]
MADLSFIEDAVAFPEKEEDEEEEEEGVEWGYEEGVEWGLVFPDANGEYQSPINLNSREARYDPSLLDVRLSPNYVVCRDCEVTNDGHTIQVILKSKSAQFLDDFEFVTLMELHLIHWNSTLFGSIDEAVGKPHGIAIIALFVQIGKEHVGLKAVTEILQDIQYKIEEFRRLRTHVKGAELVEGCDGILGDNFRPTQPLSDRVIRAAFQ